MGPFGWTTDGEGSNGLNAQESGCTNGPRGRLYHRSAVSRYPQRMSLRIETPPAPAPARWTTAAALVVGWALVVLLLLYFLEVRPRLRTDATGVATVRTAQPDFPAPPVGAVVYSRQMRDTALALGIVAEPGRVIAQASVVGAEGAGVSGLDVSFGTRGSTVTGQPCGPGCYRAALSTDAVPKAVDVVVEGDSTTRWSVPLPESWPPVDAAPLINRAERVWRALRSLSFDETLRSDESHVVTSSWQLQAPDRLAYQIADGASAVIVGERRWDRTPGGPWKASPQAPVRQPTPQWVGATNAHVVGTTAARGRPAFIVTFFDPKTPGWYTAVVDRKTFRTYDVRMVATAHFMHDRYHSFNEALAIRPPR